MKVFLIFLLVVAIAIFTGTWIFGGLAWLFEAGANIFVTLEKVFDLFGWNAGLL